MGTRPSLNEMRGEPPPEPYFPLRSRMSPFHVRSPPLSPTNEEWRRSPFPAFSRYSACGRTGLEIIGRNGERGRVTSPTLQEENLPKYIAEGKQQRIYEKTTLKDSSWEFRHEKTENKSRVEQGEPIKKHDFDVYRDQRQNFKPTESISGYQNESTIDTKEVSRPWRQDEKFNKNDFDIHPDPRHGASVPEKSLGDDFEKNLNHFWQLREGMTTLTPLATENQLVSQETTTSRDDTPKTSGIIWDVKNIFGETRTRAPPIRQTSEDQSSEIEEQDYSYREPEEQTVTNAMELLMSSERVQSTNQPGDGEEHIHGNTTKMEYENEAPSKRTSIQAKKNRFSRKHTPYYDQAFFSSLEDELSEAAGTLELSHGYPERTLEPVDVTFTLKPNKFEDTMLPKRFASIPPYRPKAVVADELFNVSTNRNTTLKRPLDYVTVQQRDEVVSLTGVSFPPYESRRKEETDILLAESQEIRNQSSKEKDTLPAATISPTSFLPPSDARRPTQLQPLSVQSWQPTFKQHQKTQVPPGYPVTTEVLRVDHSLSHRMFEHEDLPARKVSLPEYSDKQNLRTVQQMADQHSNVEDMTGQRVDGESLTGQEQLTQLPTTEMPSNKKSVLCEADTNCQPLSLRSWQATFKQKPLPDQSCVGSPQPALYIPVDNTLTHSKFEHQFLPEQKIPIPEYPNTGGFERKDVVTTTVNVFSTKQPAVGSATLVDSRERFGRYRGTFEDSGYGSSTVSQKMPPDSLRHGYTLVTASGQFPQSTKSKIKTVSPTTEKLHSPRIRHWEVEDTPPMFRNIASPESEEVAQINFPLHESPKTKKKKLFVEKRVEEVVEKIETLTDWWGGKKSFDSSFGTTTFTKEPTSESKDNKIDHSELSHTDSFKKETLSDSVNTSGVTPKTTSSMTEDMEKTFADFKQWSSKMFADGEKVLQDAREKSNKSSTQTTPLIFAPNEKVHLQGYPQTTETVAYVSEVLTNNELVHNVLINKRFSIPPYPAHPKSTSDSMQGFVSTETAKIQITDKDTKADRRTTKGQLRHITTPVTQQYQESVSTAVQTNDFTTGSKNESGPLIGTGTKNETLWQITGYPVRTEVKSEVSETLKRTELSHEELPKRARPVPPYPYFRPSLSEEQTKQERASTFKSNLLDTWKLKKTESGENDDKKTFAHRESIKLTELPEIEKFKSHPYKSEHLKTSNIDIEATFTSFKSKDLWDHRGYPKSKECVNKAPEALPFLEMEQRQLNVMKRDYPPYPVTAALKTSLGFGKSARQKEHVDAEPVTSKFSDTKTEVVKQSQQRPEDRRESQTLNMMVGFGELKEPRKMKWDARGYPSFQRAQEIHETLAPREHVHIDLSPKREDIPPYPDTWRKQNVKKESEYAEIIPKSQRQKQTEVSIQRLHSNKTKAAPAPPVSHDAKTPFWFTKGENVDRNGYPQKTEHQEVTETTSYISFSEAPVPKRYSPVPTYPVKYSEYSRLIENPSMVESRRVRTASAPPIPEHFKKPPPPYEPVRPPRHSDDVKGILKPQKHIIPEEPAAAAPLRIPRTDSDLARRDFDAVFQDDSRRSWDENNSETQISSTEVREMEILLRGATRVAETTTWQDDWDIAEEIVDESLKTAICQSRSASKTAEELNPSNTSMKSFEMEPQLGGLASESEAEIIPVPKPPQEKDYSKGVSDFSKQHHKNKGFFNFFRKKQDHHGNEQFIEESPYNIQLIAGDRPDLYREEPQMHHQPGVKGRIKKRNSREEHAIGKRPFGGIFHFRRSQSHDEVLVEERPLENVEPGPSRKRSSSMHEMFESARHNITKSKNYIYGVANKQKRREGEHVEHEQPRLIGYEHGNNELPVDVPAAPAPRFPVYKRKSEISPDTSDSDPDNIKNILAGVIREKNEVIDKIETERQVNVESSYTSASTIEIGQGVRQDTLYHAVPVNIHDEPVYPTSSENQSSIEEAALHYEEFQSAPITTTTASNYNAYYTTESTVSHDLYADAPSPPHEAEELPNESMIVEPPSPELQRSAEKFATEFTEKLAKVEDVLREAELYVQKNNNERIYDSVYEERIYDEVPANLKAEVAPPVPSSPVPKRNEELHYAAVAIATDDHLYRDDEHIYEEIGEGHVVESSPYAEPVHLSEEQHIVESTHYAEAPAYNPYDSAADEKVVVYEEPEYAEVPKEDVITKVVHKVEHSIANLKQKFESRTKESHYGRIEAPKRKDYLYDENYNAQIEDHQLSRTPEIAQTPIDHVNYREVKPYVGSPSFNKLQKQFFPEDLEERKARWEDKEEVDLSVLKSPTTIVTNNGVTEIETRAYDKNNYEETATVVVKSPVDKESALATLAIRRMSKNNQWGEDEIDSPRLYNAYESAPMSPVVKVSPLPSPRPVSVSPRFDSSPSSPRPESPKIVVKSQIGRPAELDIHVDKVTRTSPVERVVSSVEKTSASADTQFQSVSVKDRRKLFENGGAPSQPSYAPVVKLRSTAGRIGTGASVVKSVEVLPPAKVHEPVSSPAEVELKRVVVGVGATPTKQEDSNKRMSVLEMRRAYEASVTASQSSSSSASPQRSRDNSKRRGTGEVQIGTGASLSKYSEEQSSAARRTVHRTLEKHMHEGVTIPLGQGVQVSIERRDESPLTVASNSTIGQGVSVVRELQPVQRTPSPSVGYGATAVREFSPQPVQRTPSPSVGYGATAASASQQKFFSTSSSTIGQGVSVQREVHQTTSYQQSSISAIGQGALPTSAPPPVVEPLIPVQPSLTIEVPLEVAQPVQEVRESTAEVEEEPIPLQRNGSGRRSWPVKTYENNIRFDNQKKKLKMPDVDFSANGHLNGIEKMNGEENASLKDWDPRPLVQALYEVSYEPRLETKRNRFFNMEGHVEFPSDETNTLAELEREWKQRYIRTKEGRLQIFVSHCAEEAPAEDIVLSGCDIDANKEDRTFTIHGGRDHIRMLLRVPSSTFDKWRQALLSHAASSQIDAYVKPVSRTMEHLTERVIIIEIGSCSIRGGRLTQETSLPQSFFPAIGIRTDDGKIIVGEDAFAPQVRHRGEFVRPIQASDPAVERYTMDKDVVKACMNKVVSDLQVDPTKYKVLLSIPQNIPIVLISELVTIALQDIKFQGAAITRQPSLILYAYDVTTGVVVDIGDRLNIVPVIDGYVVDSAICSIPYGATQVREALRSDLCANNKGLYSFQSPIEKLILRYAMEQASYVPEDYQKEEQSRVKDVMISLDPFQPTPGMQTKFNIDSSRFTCTEGLFRPKKWGLDTKGLHHLVHEAVQMSPIDSRRTLYRNIFLAGGASLLPGLAEKLEQELANIVPNTIHTQVHISPWRYNAAYLGAQVVASSATFEDKCVTAENLQKFLYNLSTSTF